MIHQDAKPSLSTFNPYEIRWQGHAVNKIRGDFDYSSGRHDLLFSGAAGSAKSTLAAHLISTHCLQNKGALFCIGRLGLPDLKATLCREIYDHIAPDLKEGKHFSYNKTSGGFEFANGSEIITRTWHDRNYRKARSLLLSGFAVEEGTENSSEQFVNFFPEYSSRVGRRPWVKENLTLMMTNPDAPSHSIYEYYILKGNQYRDGRMISRGEKPRRHVFYSVSSDNPFLPSGYIESLYESFSEKEVRRMVFGEWVEIAKEVIYYSYDEELSVIPDFKPNPAYPIYITHDFNIALGKPMSCALFQRIGKDFIFFEEVVIEGARTEDIYDELCAKGLVNQDFYYIITGDATAKHNDTRQNHSDYDLINLYMRRRGFRFEIDVPFSNPGVRDRHIKVNGQLKNANDRTSVKIAAKCETIRKGFRLSRLKKGSQYLEDDSASQPWQHISTACGYGIMLVLQNEEKPNRVKVRKMS